MTLELNPLAIILIAILPSFFVFLAMHARQRKYEEQLKELANENLINNAIILELEQEIVNSKIIKKGIQRKDSIFNKPYDFEVRKAVF